ncbi:MAG TPA: alpha/beta fold hydrolase, partial [Bryobacteraceae bacterium]|nr:alpha/beta fold hydrolase [Bryobacteraceae bacterium]
MNREYHKWYSPSLGRDMELLVFGHAGLPVIVFPTSMGRFFDYENRQMISIIGDRYERGQIQAFCVDSVDAESWYNKSIHPAQRVARHEQYDHYLVNEVVPFIRSRNSSPELTVTGCSFGGYHSANFALKHPQLVTGFISMGGAFDIHQFLDGYYDDTCYYNCPPDFLPNLNDSALNRMNIVLAAGEYDICRAENERLSGILAAKGIAHT